ncbi:acetyl-CoA C-acetyltransferase [Streptomyces sp. NPDC005077]|uniref:acetyl-CoA C-acetyltransferase n=1 Tax=Streptomyces sp. NPDC005077 TaxID=3154292 RepID=UPI0033BD5EB2
MTASHTPATFADVVICEPVRTPVGRRDGVFAGLPAGDLATAVLEGLMARTGLGEGVVDDVILGQCYPNSEAPAIGRVAALNVGLGVETSGMQLDRRCGSGLQAVMYACLQVAAGVSDVIIAGGVESMSNAEHYALGLRKGTRSASIELHDRISRGRTTAGGHHYPVPGGMLETAENLRAEYRISREEQDELALRSQRAAGKAMRDGRFAEEIVPVTVPAHGKRPAVQVTEDEHPRPDVTPADLQRLRPVHLDIDPEATVTAGNASGENDGASACVVTTRARAEQLGLRPFVRPLSWSVAGVPPRTMGIGPVPATAKLLDRLGLRLADMDLIELNEAFAAQVLACLREWNFTDADYDRFNVNGSGISLGHPVGATGARILTTVARELERREGRYALETMCLGGGQGMAAVFERVA